MKIFAVLLGGVLLGVVAVILFDQPRDEGRLEDVGGIAGAEASGGTRAELPVADLLEELRRIRVLLERSNGRAKEAVKTVPFRSPDSTVGQKDLVELLRPLIGRGEGRPALPSFDQVKEPGFLPTADARKEAARRTQLVQDSETFRRQNLFRPYGSILQEYGLPDNIGVDAGGALRWSYGDFTLIFFEGFVINAYN